MVSVRLAFCLGAVMFVASALSQGGQGRGGGHRMPTSPEAQLLRRAIQASTTLPYIGVRVTVSREGNDLVRTTERIFRNRTQMRIEFIGDSPNAGEVVVTDKNRRSHFFPKSNEIQVQEGPQEPPLNRLARMIEPGRGGFRLRFGAKATLAGQATQSIEWVDRFGNAAARLWVDTDNGMALKRENFDPSGRLVGSFEFTSINYNPVFKPGDFEIRRAGAVVRTLPEVRDRLFRELKMPIVELKPSTGFRLENAQRLRSGRNEGVSQMYIGPEGRVSLFVSRQRIDPQRLGRVGRGRVQSAVREINGLSIVLIGDLSEEAIEALAKEVATRS